MLQLFQCGQSGEVREGVLGKYFSSREHLNLRVCAEHSKIYPGPLLACGLAGVLFVKFVM